MFINLQRSLKFADNRVNFLRMPLLSQKKGPSLVTTDDVKSKIFSWLVFVCISGRIIHVFVSFVLCTVVSFCFEGEPHLNQSNSEYLKSFQATSVHRLYKQWINSSHELQSLLLVIHWHQYQQWLYRVLPIWHQQWLYKVWHTDSTDRSNGKKMSICLLFFCRFEL